VTKRAWRLAGAAGRELGRPEVEQGHANSVVPGFEDVLDGEAAACAQICLEAWMDRTRSNMEGKHAASNFRRSRSSPRGCGLVGEADN
jgi:hypothetical protein